MDKIAYYNISPYKFVGVKKYNESEEQSEGNEIIIYERFQHESALSGANMFSKPIQHF